MSELKVRSVNKKFRQKTSFKNAGSVFRKESVLEDINLTFESGKIYGLLGRNGVGKSTLMKIINERIFPTSGEIFLDNQTICGKDDLLEQIFLMNEDNLYGSMTVKEALQMTNKLYIGFDMENAIRLAEAFKVSEKSKVNKLSTGYETIFKLIIGLNVPAPFVFFDEPILGLDANHRDLFYKEMLNVYAQGDKTFIISTHLIEEVSDLLEEVIILKDKKVILDMPVTDLLDKTYQITGPKEEVEMYLGKTELIGKDSMANLVTYYTMAILPDKPIPDLVTIATVPLQKAFVLLTDKMENEVWNDEK